MTITRRNLLWPVLVIGTGAILLLLAIDVLPPSIDDLMRRSWAILLVVAGLNMLLIDRIPFGNWLALGLSAAVLGVIIVFAYQTQAENQRSDYVEMVEPVPLGDNIQAVRLDVETRAATVAFRLTDDGARAIGATFTGSEESAVSIAIQEDEPGVVNLRLRETQRNSIPSLDKIGSGELIVYLPTGIPVTSLNFRNESGLVTFDFRAVDITQFDLVNLKGDVDLYMPLRGITIGDLQIDDGNLRILVDPSSTLRVSGAPQQNTELDINTYQLLADGTIESRGGLTEFQFNLRIVDLGGTLTIQAPQEG